MARPTWNDPLILVVDNHDSFTFNLVQLLGALGEQPIVVRPFASSIDELVQLSPTSVLISPGPGHPRDASYSLDVLQRFLGRVPVLGVCLGHQCLATVLGADVGLADHPVHGYTSPAHHCGDHLFRNMVSPIDVGRYHSLVVREHTLPSGTHVCARTASGEVMAIADPALRAFGVQFHPESFLTPFGHQIVSNFLLTANTDAALR